MKRVDLLCNTANPTVSVISVKGIDYPVVDSVPLIAAVENMERIDNVDSAVSS